MKELPRRYLVFFSGVLVCATGIAFITRAALGSSPISATPLVLSLITPDYLSMGVFTFAFNMLFLAVEALLMRRFTLTQALAIPATLFFSLCIDCAMSLIPLQLNGPLPLRAAYLLLGCCLMALGISLEVIGSVVLLPGESVVKAIAHRMGKVFGNVKVGFDVALTLAASVIALFAFHRLNGVGAGTLVSALLVGQIVKLFTPRLGAVRKFCAVSEA